MPTKSNRQLIKNLHRRMKENKLDEVSKILSERPDLVAQKHPSSGKSAVQIARGEEMNILVTKAEGAILTMDL